MSIHITLQSTLGYGYKDGDITIDIDGSDSVIVYSRYNANQLLNLLPTYIHSRESISLMSIIIAIMYHTHPTIHRSITFSINNTHVRKYINEGIMGNVQHGILYDMLYDLLRMYESIRVI